MSYDPFRHRRRSIRLKDYDYSQPGHYFVTICTAGRQLLLARFEDEDILLNAAGRLIRQTWVDIRVRFPHVELDEFVVMPNHFHGIVVITERSPPGEKRPTLGQIVGYFKYHSTRLYNLLEKTDGVKLWQRNYYEHIIRNEREWNAVRRYIRDNPQNWLQDVDNPAAAGRPRR